MKVPVTIQIVIAKQKQSNHEPSVIKYYTVLLEDVYSAFKMPEGFIIDGYLPDTLSGYVEIPDTNFSCKDGNGNKVILETAVIEVHYDSDMKSVLYEAANHITAKVPQEDGTRKAISCLFEQK